MPKARAQKGQKPLVCLTAYTTPMARVLDRHVDILLVGDSVGMVLYGMDTTLDVDLAMMIRHGQAVMRGSKRSLVIVDLPFGSYEHSPESAFETASHVMAATGCGAVKLEGGVALAPTIKFLTERGIPVLAHVGLMPQRIHALGGFRNQGREESQSTTVKNDAIAVAEAGAFAVVVEAVVEQLAKDVTDIIPIPTIGIGASPSCDGQILVSDDAFGLFGTFTPKFVKKFADLLPQIDRAAEQYSAEVRSRTFPSADHIFKAT